jgi:hypothetical protein
VAGTFNSVKDPVSSLTNTGQLAIKGNSVQLDFIDTDHPTDWAINVGNGKLSFVRAPNSKDLVIDDNGNVGIGTERPIAKLDVAGNIRSTGIIQALGYRFLVQGFEFELNDGLLTPLNANLERVVFSYTGKEQVLPIPAGVEWIFVKLWGAGGGSGKAGSWNHGADGGGGGHTRGLFKVIPNESLTIVVGSGGTTAGGNTTTIYGGGGTNQGAKEPLEVNSYGGHGGGYCGVFRASVSQAYALAIAGGGGGGGASRDRVGNHGGAGGGRSGQRGASPFDEKFSAGGGGGTQTIDGGKGGKLTFSDARPGGDGIALCGGVSAVPCWSGAGGGGYFGGGGGAYHPPRTKGGGGGGSGFTVPGGLLTGTYTGCFRLPAYFWDPDLLSDAAEVEAPGFGGQNRDGFLWSGAPSGGHARAVIYYLKPDAPKK